MHHALADLSRATLLLRAKNPNPQLAFSLLLSAAASYAPAQNNLGILHESGFGCEKDPQEAKKWYKLAASTGLASALCNLGRMHAHEGNYTTALDSLRSAASKGCHEAEYHLALLHLGTGHLMQGDRPLVKKDTAVARMHLEKAVEGNVVPAMIALADLLSSSKPTDHTRAFGLYSAAAHASNPLAMVRLARMHELGIATTRDPRTAEKWFRRAAKSGESAGWAGLARCREEEGDTGGAAKCYIEVGHQLNEWSVNIGVDRLFVHAGRTQGLQRSIQQTPGTSGAARWRFRF